MRKTKLIISGIFENVRAFEKVFEADWHRAYIVPMVAKHQVKLLNRWYNIHIWRPGKECKVTMCMNSLYRIKKCLYSWQASVNIYFFKWVVFHILTCNWYAGAPPLSAAHENARIPVHYGTPSVTKPHAHCGSTWEHPGRPETPWVKLRTLSPQVDLSHARST